MSQYTVDHVGRMRQIKAALDQSGEAADAVQQKENMLEELLDIVDNIDYARGKACYIMSIALCRWKHQHQHCLCHNMEAYILLMF